MSAIPKLNVRAMQRKIQRHKDAIAKHRDALRAMLDDVEAVCEKSDQAAQCLVEAIDALSEYL